MKHPRKVSMNQHSEFMLCRVKGASKAGKYLVLSTKTETSLSCNKFAYIITKKVGKAHDRNAIRRKLRAITCAHGDQITQNRYLVVIVRWSAIGVSYHELEKDWLKLAAKLKVIPR